MKIEVIQKKSLAEEVAEQIRKQITAGILNRGDKIPVEQDLMRSFGVGRSTVREAVRILSNMGYLSVQQGRGTFVNDSSVSGGLLEQRMKQADIREMSEVRNILERPIAEMAAQRRSEADIEALRQLVSKRLEAARAGDLEACIQADIAFHTAVARATHNEIIYELYRITATHLLKGYNHIYTDTSSFIASQSLHEMLVKYISKGNGKEASETASLFWGEVNEIVNH